VSNISYIDIKEVMELTEAVIVIDMIHDFVDGKFGSERAQKIVPRIKSLLDRAREKGIPVIYVKDAHVEGDKELEVWGKHAMKDDEGSQIIPELAPQPGDYVLEKNRYSCFYETGLEDLLYDLDVKEVILTGVATDICVRHTAADAFFRGFDIIIPRDCVDTFSDDVQERALDEMAKLYKARIEDSEKVIV